MSKPIAIDLRDLTDEHVEEAIAAGRLKCMYTAPCIIGTLIPVSKRGYMPDESVDSLIRQGVITIPENQKTMADELQDLFDRPHKHSDSAVRDYVREIVAKLKEEENDNAKSS